MDRKTVDHGRLDQVTMREPNCRISNGLVWPFVELALEHGCDIFVARCRAQLDLQLDHAEANIPLQAVAPLLTELVATLGMQHVGLLAAQQIEAKHLGLAEYLARSKDTLGAAIVSSIRHAYLLCDGAHRSVAIQDDNVIVRFWFDEDISIHHAAHEFALALLLTCARRITQLADLRPTEVHFVHQQPSDVALHEQHFRCRLRFDMPVAALVFPSQFMELPLPGAEPALSRLLDQQAAFILAGKPSPKRVTPQVRELLAADLGLRKPSATRVATVLGIGRRTLSRRLEREHTSFQLLFDQARRDRAVQELRETERSIKDISERLGFASTQSFHRAFRRWTGTTAMSFRGGANRRSAQAVTLLSTTIHHESAPRLRPDVARMADSNERASETDSAF